MRDLDAGVNVPEVVEALGRIREMLTLAKFFLLRNWTATTRLKIRRSFQMRRINVFRTWSLVESW